MLWADSNSIWPLGFHPNGKTLASTSDDGSVQLWDIGGVSGLIPGQIVILKQLGAIVES